jgi:hypothetical protein
VGFRPCASAADALRAQESATSEHEQADVDGERPTVPASVNIATTAVVTETAVPISATYRGLTQTATLTVDASQPTSLTLWPREVKGFGSKANNTVKLDGTARRACRTPRSMPMPRLEDSSLVLFGIEHDRAGAPLAKQAKKTPEIGWVRATAVFIAQTKCSSRRCVGRLIFFRAHALALESRVALLRRDDGTPRHTPSYFAGFVELIDFGHACCKDEPSCENMLNALPAPVLLDVAILFTALAWCLGFYLVDRRVYCSLRSRLVVSSVFLGIVSRAWVHRCGP